MLTLEAVQKEYKETLEQLSNPELVLDWSESRDSDSQAGAEKLKKLLERKNYLENIIEKEKEIKELQNRIAENKDILNSNEDAELFSLAEIEIGQLNQRLKILEKELQGLLAKSEEKIEENQENKENLPSAMIIEIRAGTGGQEAALFAADLFRMYSKYSQSNNWEQKVLDSKPAELDGLKEIVFELKSSGKNQENVWTLMKYEGGVHRVQRIPATEKSGRIHTSTASVAILPRPKKGKIIINPQDLKTDTYKASGPGGQYVNKRETAVRVTHLPTGTVVTSQTARSLQQNKENALSILEAKILEKKVKEQEEKLKDERKTQIGRAERSEKIRTYNFPQNRITDHRIKKSFHNLEQVMEGKLEPIVSALQKSS